MGRICTLGCILPANDLALVAADVAEYADSFVSFVSFVVKLRSYETIGMDLLERHTEPRSGWR